MRNSARRNGTNATEQCYFSICRFRVDVVNKARDSRLPFSVNRKLIFVQGFRPKHELDATKDSGYRNV